MNIQDIIKEQEIELDEKLKETLGVYNGEILNKFQDEYLMEKGPGCERILFPVLEKSTKDFINPPEDSPYIKVNDASIIKNWHKSSSKALLEAVIEIAEKMKKEIIKTAQTKSELLLSVDYGYNQAFSDLQSKLKEEIDNINK